MARTMRCSTPCGPRDGLPRRSSSLAGGCAPAPHVVQRCGSADTGWPTAVVSDAGLSMTGDDTSTRLASGCQLVVGTPTTNPCTILMPTRSRPVRSCGRSTFCASKRVPKGPAMRAERGAGVLVTALAPALRDEGLCELDHGRAHRGQLVLGRVPRDVAHGERRARSLERVDVMCDAAHIPRIRRRRQLDDHAVEVIGLRERAPYRVALEGRGAHVDREKAVGGAFRPAGQGGANRERLELVLTASSRCLREPLEGGVARADRRTWPTPRTRPRSWCAGPRWAGGTQRSPRSRGRGRGAGSRSARRRCAGSGRPAVERDIRLVPAGRTCSSSAPRGSIAGRRPPEISAATHSMNAGTSSSGRNRGWVARTAATCPTGRPASSELTASAASCSRAISRTGSAPIDGSATTTA